MTPHGLESWEFHHPSKLSEMSEVTVKNAFLSRFPGVIASLSSHNVFLHVKERGDESSKGQVAKSDAPKVEKEARKALTASMC